MEPYIGEIRLFALPYAPLGWLDCNGALLDVGSHIMLFSVIGSAYGGDGQKNFALPDLQGRAVLGAGNGVGLQSRPAGSVVGSETVALTTPHLPPHTHAVTTYSTGKDEELSDKATAVHFLSRYKVKGSTKLAKYFLKPPAGKHIANVKLSARTISAFGGDEPHGNMQPYLTLRYCIADQGIYPVPQ